MLQQTEAKSILPQFVEVKRAVLYARVSGDDTRREGRNIKGQLEMGRKFAAEKGYRVTEELAEDERKNTSGADMNLPQLNRIIDMAQASQFDVLIGRELDRFARSLAKQLVIEQQLKRAGVTIEYIMGEYPDTPEGQLNKQIKAVIAEYERAKTTQRMVRGKNQVAKAGQVIPSDRIPYGYRLNSDRTNFEIIKDEAKVIQDIFDWYIFERLSIYKIAQRLTKAGPRFIEQHEMPAAPGPVLEANDFDARPAGERPQCGGEIGSIDWDALRGFTLD
jgi:site-specific DNA recombinase